MAIVSVYVFATVRGLSVSRVIVALGPAAEHLSSLGRNSSSTIPCSTRVANEQLLLIVWATTKPVGAKTRISAWIELDLTSSCSG